MKDPNILIIVFFPESTGAIDGINQATWSIPELTFAVAKIFNAANWWAANAPSCIQLSFMLEGELVTTGVEPIAHIADPDGPPASCPGEAGQGVWINEIMDAKFMAGAGFACYWDKVRGYADERRIFRDTDWAITFFVVNDEGDMDSNGNGFVGDFVDGFFAYTYLGGPFIVMTKRNDGWGFFNMDAVAAHEIGHEFYALDEYCVATDPSSGYLNIPNGNSLLLFPGECPTDFPWLSTAGQQCIMRGGTPPFENNQICSFTHDAIGWRDDDGDMIPDVVDTFPIVPDFSPPPPFLASSVTPITINGFAHVNPRPNANPLGAGNDISVNTITKVFFIVDPPSPPAPTQAAFATDGKYDEGLEDFFFTIGPFLPNTNHTIEVFAEAQTGCVGKLNLGPSTKKEIGILPPVVPVTTCP